MPADALLSHPHVASARSRRSEWTEQTIKVLSASFSVSREVVVRRLLILGLTSEDFYERKREEYEGQFRARQLRLAERGTSPIAPVPRLVVRDNGRRYTRLVLEAFERERITPADVSDYLGTRLKHLDQIASAVQTTVQSGA